MLPASIIVHAEPCWPQRSWGLCFLPDGVAEYLVSGSGNLTLFQALAPIRNEGPVVQIWRISEGISLFWKLGMA